MRCVVAAAVCQEDDSTVKAVLATIKPQIDALQQSIVEKREKHQELQ